MLLGLSGYSPTVSAGLPSQWPRVSPGLPGKSAPWLAWPIIYNFNLFTWPITLLTYDLPWFTWLLTWFEGVGRGGQVLQRAADCGLHVVVERAWRGPQPAGLFPAALPWWLHLSGAGRGTDGTVIHLEEGGGDQVGSTGLNEQDRGFGVWMYNLKSEKEGTVC